VSLRFGGPAVPAMKELDARSLGYAAARNSIQPTPNAPNYAVRAAVEAFGDMGASTRLTRSIFSPSALSWKQTWDCVQNWSVAFACSCMPDTHSAPKFLAAAQPGERKVGPARKLCPSARHLIEGFWAASAVDRVGNTVKPRTFCNRMVASVKASNSITLPRLMSSTVGADDKHQVRSYSITLSVERAP
jgi:hypothetical protein